MEINFDSLFMMVKFAASMIGLLLLIYLLARLTPWAAKKIDTRFFKKSNPERVDDVNPPEVKGIYDAQVSVDSDNIEQNMDGDAKNGK